VKILFFALDTLISSWIQCYTSCIHFALKLQSGSSRRLALQREPQIPKIISYERLLISRIANPGYLEAVHGLADDVRSHGSTKQDAITVVFHVVDVCVESDFTEAMAEVSMIIAWDETYSILEQ